MMRERARMMRDSVASWWQRSSLDVALVVAVTLVAAALRLVMLDSVPPGLHGDEAWTGLDARRIVDEGWIGPYVPSAGGQPTGPLYFTAALFHLFPDTTMTLRVSMALLGVATIPAAYLAFSAMFSRRVALLAAVLLAGMMWHLHLSRTAFMVTAWPLMEMLTLWSLALAMQRRNAWLFVAAGAVCGLGLYTYNAYLVFLPVPFAGLAWMLARERGVRERTRSGLLALAFVAAGVLAAMPLLRYATDDWTAYSGHHRFVSVRETQEWKDAGVAGRADILLDRTGEWLGGLVVGGRTDFGDGLASDGHPVIGAATFALACAGIGIALYQWRRPPYAMMIAAVLVLPLGAVLTTEDGLFRRTLGLAPFVALLAALPLDLLWQRAERYRAEWRPWALGAVAAVPLIIGARTEYEYFGPVQDDTEVRLVFPYELDGASRYLATLPRNTPVYLYSDRWRFSYETRRFLAPGMGGTDRSLRYRQLPPGVDQPPVDYSAPPGAPAVFVFIDSYTPPVHIETVRGMYPGGEYHEGQRDGRVSFRAYYLQRVP